MNSLKVLFVSHDASRTGAPIMLLNLLRWMKSNTEIDFSVLVKYDGPLMEQFGEIAPAYCLYPQHRQEKASLGEKVVRKIRHKTIDKFYPTRLYNKLAAEKFDLIYVNTVPNGEVVKQLKDRMACPVLTHIHELQSTIELFGKKNLDIIKTFTRRYIAASDAVRDALNGYFHIPGEQVSLVYSCIDVERFHPEDHPPGKVYEELEIAGEAPFIVGAAGTIEWRKGYDLFIAAARAVLKKLPAADIYFVWVGAEQERGALLKIAHDLKLLGLESRVKFIGSRSEPVPYFAAFDTFFLSSREDPYPLVCLEAAALKKTNIVL